MRTVGNIMLPCSLYQPAVLAAATPAGVGYDVQADGRRFGGGRVAGGRRCFGRIYSRALAREMLFAGFASYLLLQIYFPVA